MKEERNEQFSSLSLNEGKISPPPFFFSSYLRKGNETGGCVKYQSRQAER